MAAIAEKYLIMVTLNNNNKFYRMIPDEDKKNFTVIYGRVGTAGQKTRYSIRDWDKIYNSKIEKGYVDQTAIMAASGSDEEEEFGFKPITNNNIRKIVEHLQKVARQTVKTNYKISSSQVTVEMVEEAEKILAKMSQEKEKVKFNQLLIKLFETIPRKMTNVMAHTARTEAEMGKILQDESDLLDVMKGQMQTGRVVKKDTKKTGTILDTLGLVFEECTPEELKQIKRHLDPDTQNRFRNAWVVKNLRTETAFNKYVEERKIRDFRYYYHGSRSENWWSIINGGLKLNPTNAVITGKMFGHGIYFAPKAKKSCGYMSTSGSYWAKGRDSFGYLAVYKIAYGKPMDVHSFDSKFYSYHEKDLKSKGFDCLHAHAGNMLVNDEVVIYNESAATIRYLIEIAA